MIFFLKTIVSCSFLLIYYNLSAQKVIKIGIILNKVDSTPIENAHVINFDSNLGVKSNINGEFRITAKKEDTLLISFIGFKSLKIIASKILKYIYLEKEIYSLDSYTVLPYKNFKEFKDAFVKLEIPDTARNKLNQSFVLSVEELRSYEPVTSGLVARGAISALASKFNKRIQDKINYEKLLERDQYEAFISTRFNRQLIERVTQLKDNKSIKSFMEYCDFTNSFIELSSDYEIINQIFKCYDEYNVLPVVSK